MSEEQFSYETQLKMYDKRSLEISKNGYKATPIADEKLEERIKKKGYESRVVPSNVCHRELRHKNPRYVTMGHVFAGSESGELEPGSSSGQQAMDADGSSGDKPVRDEFTRWLTRKTAREMRLSDYPLSNLLSKSNKSEWSVVVAPGRYVTVDPGPLLLINKISYDADPLVIIHGAPNCQLYLRINRTREEWVIGHLRPGSWNEIHVHLLVNEKFTIGHSGFNCVRFSGYKYFPRGQPEPLPSELRVTEPQGKRPEDPFRWTLPMELTAKVFSYLSSSEVAEVAERVCVFFRAAGRDPFAYANIDLCNLRYGENLIALMCLRRAHLTINSLAVGFSYRYPEDFDLNSMYSGRFLEPLRYLGMGLKKLKLVGLDLIGPEDLTPVLAICAVLTNLELHKLGLVTLEYAMQVASAHCTHLQVFEYTSKDPEDVSLGEVAEDTLQVFLTSLPHVTSLSLNGVHLLDRQLFLIMHGIKLLRSLDLSDSSRFTGSFLAELLNQELVLEVLVLKRCIDLEEGQLGVFTTHLGENALFFHKLESLVIIGFENGGHLEEGFEGRIGLDALSVARPAINILTDFELEQPAELVQEDLDRYVLDAFDPINEQEAVWNEEYEEWEYQVEVPNEELDVERYAILPNNLRRKRMGLVYWGERRDQ